MSKKILNLIVFLALSILTVLPLSAKEPEMQLTPVILQVLNPPNPFPGSDGEYHLVYEIQLTNISSQSWSVDRVKALSQDRMLSELSGTELEARMGPLSKRGGSTELGANQTAFLWMHLKFPSKDALPRSLGHQIGLRGTGKSLEVRGAAATVSLAEPPVISAPLQGDNWLAGDGCCDSIRHVRAMLPVDGRLYSAQRFAIDWEKFNEEKKIYSGDSKNPENYFCYGQNVLAVADAVVVALLDGLPNQVPGKLPESIDVNQADGNHLILKLSPAQYALYAHLKPGSIRVKVGDRVQAGQVIGQIGNSGNTSEPHLHFHLMDGPSPLASNGVPYLLQSFEILGKVKSTEAFDKAAADGTALPIEASKYQGRHQNQLPLDLSQVRFP